MADRAVDKDGNVYEKGVDGLYLPKYGSYGGERERDRYAQPAIPRDGSSSPQEIRPLNGRPKESADVEALFRPRRGGETFANRFSVGRVAALLIGALLVAGLIAGLVYAGLQITPESRSWIFWGVSLVIVVWAVSTEPTSSFAWPTWWLTISKWPRKNLLNSLVFVVVATVFLHWVFVTLAPGGTASPVHAENSSPARASDPSTPSHTAAPTPLPQATPTAEPMVWVVGNTDGLGVYLRSEPRMGARVGAAYPDGTQLTQEGADVEGDGHTWKRVSAPDGRQGYVPGDYVLSTP